MTIQPDILELIDQQQQDRRQLLRYAERLDAMSSEVRRQAETIERLTERLARLDAEHAHLREAHAVEVADLHARREHDAVALADLHARREHDAVALAELRAWREAMERSRTYRLMRRLAALDRLPLIGPLLRALRRALPRGVS